MSTPLPYSDRPHFTPLEWEIIEHRLEIPDCIVECIASEDPEDQKYHPDDVYLVAECLLKKDWLSAYAHSAEITAAVLEDAINGSTFFGSIDLAVAEGDITQQKMNAYVRAANSIMKKFEAAYDQAVSLPLC